MERELNATQFDRLMPTGNTPGAHLQQTRERTAAMFDAADQLLDAIDARLAEELLQQSRQRSAQ